MLLGLKGLKKIIGSRTGGESQGVSAPSPHPLPWHRLRAWGKSQRVGLWFSHWSSVISHWTGGRSGLGVAIIWMP